MDGWLSVRDRRNSPLNRSLTGLNEVRGFSDFALPCTADVDAGAAVVAALAICVGLVRRRGLAGGVATTASLPEDMTPSYENILECADGTGDGTIEFDSDLSGLSLPSTRISGTLN